MSVPTQIVGTCRRAVITGLSRKPEWSELSDKLTFLKYAKITNNETEEEKYVVYAHSPLALRQAAWMKLFPGAETVQKVGEFEECEMYLDFERDGLLKTLGEPLRKDAVRDKKRKARDEKSDEKSDDRSHKVQKTDAELWKAALEGKVVTLCKQVEAAKAELLQNPARLRVAENTKALLHLLRLTAEKGTWAEEASALALLRQEKKAVWREWLAQKPAYEAKRKEYVGLRLKMWQAMVEENEKRRRANAGLHKIKRDYPIEDKDTWGPEEADKLRPVFEQVKVMRRLKRWMRSWADDDAEEREASVEASVEERAEYEKYQSMEADFWKAAMEDEYARMMQGLEKTIDVENGKFTHVVLMTKPGEKSVDWRNYGHEGRYERARNNTWKKVLKCGIDQVVMMVDRTERNHQVTARSQVPMTLGEWNDVFDCAKMTVCDVFTCLPEADLIEPVRNAEEDDVEFFWLRTDDEIQERYLKCKAEMREDEMPHAKGTVSAVVPVAV